MFNTNNRLDNFASYVRSVDQRVSDLERRFQLLLDYLELRYEKVTTQTDSRPPRTKEGFVKHTYYPVMPVCAVMSVPSATKPRRKKKKSHA